MFLLGYQCWTSDLLYDQEFAVVMYNAKIMLATNFKYVTFYRFQWPPGILCDIVLSFVHVAWKPWHAVQFLIVSSMLAFILTTYMDSHANSPVFCIPIWLMCSCSSDVFCSTAGTIILLPFISIPAMITISSLNDQYGCSSFCISGFVKG